MIRPVFADPKTDFAFQRIFGSEDHKPALLGFLNDLLELDDPTASAPSRYCPRSSSPKVSEFEYSIVDVKCVDVRLQPGATQVLVEQGFAASLIPHGESDKPADEVIQSARITSHRSTWSWTSSVVHTLICAHQETADAVTRAGQHARIPLPCGTYKTRPNSPRRPGGSIHQYCPPEHVAAEMEQLVAIYGQLMLTEPLVLYPASRRGGRAAKRTVPSMARGEHHDLAGRLDQVPVRLSG